MFIHWVRVKMVMAELWDPEDLTVGAGRKGLTNLYSLLCDDKGVRDAFTMVANVAGEQLFQKMAVLWKEQVLRYVDGLSDLPPQKKTDLRAQVIEMIEGRRSFLQ